MAKQLHNAPLKNFNGEEMIFADENDSERPLTPALLIGWWADNWPVTEKTSMKQMRTAGEISKYCSDSHELGVLRLETHWWDSIRGVMNEHMPKVYRLNAPVLMDELDARVKLNGKVSEDDPDVEPELEAVPDPPEKAKKTS